MNTNPDAVRILCYGDSNTHGRDAKRKAEEGVKVRYPADIRWTGQLQDLLGNEYEVIEEGLGNRTTNLEDPLLAGRNGLSYLIPCLDSHTPLDIVILMLGTNDLKEVYGRTAKEIAHANKALVNEIKARFPKIKIVLVSPALVDETNSIAATKYRNATAKSEKLAGEYQIVAKTIGCSFINLAEHVSPSLYDGVHLDAESQSKVAQIMCEEVVKICH